MTEFSNNYILTKDKGFSIFNSLFQIIKPEIQQEIKLSPPRASTKTTNTKKLQKYVPYKTNSKEFAMIWSCLKIINDSPDGNYSPLYLWSLFCSYIKNKHIYLTLQWVDMEFLEDFLQESFRMALNYQLIETVSKNFNSNSIVINLEAPILNFNNFENEINTYSEKILEKPIHLRHKEELNFICHVAKQIYNIFNLPTVTPVKNKNNVGKNGFIINSSSIPYPIHKHPFYLLGSAKHTKGEYYNQWLYSSPFNYNVCFGRGTIHHLGDDISKIIAAMAIESTVTLGLSSDNNFFYFISNSFDENNFVKPTIDKYGKKTPKKNLALVWDKGVEGENYISSMPFKKGISSSNTCIHRYADNPVFQKFAGRKIKTITTKQLKKRLLNFYKNKNTKPFFIKSISGKFIIDVVGTQLNNSTYQVKEGRIGIKKIELDNTYLSVNNDENNEDKISSLLYKQLCKSSIYGSSYEAMEYLSTLENNPQPQWIISDIVDMHDEYRIFVVNHKVVTGSPCHRRSTPFNMYPVGRFHPGLSFSHKSKFIRLNQETRNKVAKYIRFSRQFAREMKHYGISHNGYDTANHGNYVLDVAWSNKKNKVIAIEINEMEPNNPGNIGLYAINIIKLTVALMNNKQNNKKYNFLYTCNFIYWLKKFAFYDISKLDSENSYIKNHQYKKINNKYINKDNLPVILKRNIYTGKNNNKYHYICNKYLSYVNKHMKK